MDGDSTLVLSSVRCFASIERIGTLRSKKRFGSVIDKSRFASVCYGTLRYATLRFASVRFAYRLTLIAYRLSIGRNLVQLVTSIFMTSLSVVSLWLWLSVGW